MMYASPKSWDALSKCLGGTFGLFMPFWQTTYIVHHLQQQFLKFLLPGLIKLHKGKTCFFTLLF